MWWPRNIIFFSVIFLLLTGCGFQPLHGKSSASEDIIATLPAIDINVTTQNAKDKQLAQFLQRQLENLINPLNKKTKKIYRLDVSMTKTQSALAIQQDATVTSYRLLVNADYELSYAPKRTLLTKGRISNFSSYDQVDSQYSTLVSEQFSSEQLLKETAKRLQLKIISDFSQLKQGQEAS